MQIPFRKHVGWSAWFAIACLAVLLRAAVPAGYMVAQDHGPHLVICSGHASTAAETGGKSSPDPHKPDPHKPDQPCAFAGTHVALQAPVLPAPVPRTQLPTGTVILGRASLVPGRGLAAPPPPSTGPPARL